MPEASGKVDPEVNASEGQDVRKGMIFQVDD